MYIKSVAVSSFIYTYLHLHPLPFFITSSHFQLEMNSINNPVSLLFSKFCIYCSLWIIQNVLIFQVIPCVASLPGGRMQPGHYIIIHGEPLPNCNRWVNYRKKFPLLNSLPRSTCRFNINLIQYASQKCIFHFDARFDQGATVRNTNYPNNWGPEERSPLNLLQRGRRFALELRLMGDRYLVILSIIRFTASSMLHIPRLWFREYL